MNKQRKSKSSSLFKKKTFIKNFNIFSLKTTFGEDATQVNGCFSKNSQKEAVDSNKSLHSRYEGVHRPFSINFSP